jgi:hypothetical protein
MGLRHESCIAQMFCLLSLEAAVSDACKHCIKPAKNLCVTNVNHLVEPLRNDRGNGHY